MFPLQQSDELLHQIFSTTNQHKIPQDPITGHTVVEANPIFTNGTAKTRRRKACHTEASGGGDKYKKQKLHREIER
ncbi:hypothetical protein GQ457_17G025880 [Hibiscus cannabinus]